MSNSFSAVLTIGRDAEVRFSQAGQSILTVSAANIIGYGDKKITQWIRVTVFGKRAEGELVNWLKKGVQIYVVGELKLNEYQANDGTTKSSLELNANILDLVGGKREENQQQPVQQQRQQAQTQQRPVASQQRQAAKQDDFDDDIPF